MIELGLDRTLFSIKYIHSDELYLCDTIRRPSHVHAYCLDHRLRMHDGYFPSSSHPISYLGYTWVRSEIFLVGKRIDRNHNAKNGADSTAENTPNTPKFIWPICTIGPKVCDSVEIGLHRVSVVRFLDGLQCTVICYACVRDKSLSMFCNKVCIWVQAFIECA